MKNRIRGFTLFELMVSLSIAIPLMLVGSSNIKPLVLKSKMTNHVNTFISMQRLARQNAIFRQSIVTFCASKNGEVCLSKTHWHEGVLSFTDHNSNRVVDDSDYIIHFQKTEIANLQVTWRAFQNRSYLQFDTNGWTESQNGTFRFCFINESDAFSRALIINSAGRLRLSTDSNNDGFHEDANGDKITC